MERSGRWAGGYAPEQRVEGEEEGERPSDSLFTGSWRVQIEMLPEVERAFVHVDYEQRHLPEHKVRWTGGRGWAGRPRRLRAHEARGAACRASGATALVLLSLASGEGVIGRSCYGERWLHCALLCLVLQVERQLLLQHQAQEAVQRSASGNVAAV